MSADLRTTCVGHAILPAKSDFVGVVNQGRRKHYCMWCMHPGPHVMVVSHFANAMHPCLSNEKTEQKLDKVCTSLRALFVPGAAVSCH